MQILMVYIFLQDWNNNLGINDISKELTHDRERVFITLSFVVG